MMGKLLMFLITENILGKEADAGFSFSHNVSQASSARLLILWNMC